MKKHFFATLLALIAFSVFAAGADAPNVVPPLTEKDLTLAIAQALYAQCRTMYADKTVLITRESDVTMSHAQRADFVNNARKEGGATVVVSIHLNFSFSSMAQGFEVFYAQSPEFAQSIAHALEREIGRQSPSRGVKEDLYFMLTHTDAHAVLVECGFISNPAEATLLATQDYRQKIATGLTNGIAQFIAENPMVGVIVIAPVTAAKTLSCEGIKTEGEKGRGEHSITVRAEQHCTRPIHRRFGLKGSVRALLAFYNTLAQIDALVCAVRELAWKGLAVKRLPSPPLWRTR